MKTTLTILSVLLTAVLYAQDDHAYIDSNYIKKMRANRIDTPIIDYGNSDGFVYILNNVPLSDSSKQKSIPKPPPQTSGDKAKLKG